MSRVDALALLEDIERHDYAHVSENGDLLKVRVTLDVLVSREQWDALHGTGTDPQKIRESVQRVTRDMVLAHSEGKIDGIVNVILRRFAALAAAQHLGIRPRR